MVFISLCLYVILVHFKAVPFYTKTELYYRYIQESRVIYVKLTNGRGKNMLYSRGTVFIYETGGGYKRIK